MSFCTGIGNSREEDDLWPTDLASIKTECDISNCQNGSVLQHHTMVFAHGKEMVRYHVGVFIDRSDGSHRRRSCRHVLDRFLRPFGRDR